MRKELCAVICLSCPLLLPAQQTDSCRTIHGRAHFYGGDGQLRIWEIGTHHEYRPDQASDSVVLGWLEAGVNKSERPDYASPASAVYMFGDFVICPVEPYKKGAVQTVAVKSVEHRRYVPAAYRAKNHFGKIYGSAASVV